LNKKILLFILTLFFSCFKNSLIDRISEDYFPIYNGFKSKFLNTYDGQIYYIEVTKDTLILGENSKEVSFFGERNYFLKKDAFLRRYFKKIFYSGENEYLIEENFLPFIPSIFIKGEIIVDSLRKNFLIEGDTLNYFRKILIRIKGPSNFSLGDVEFENTFEVKREFYIKVKFSGEIQEDKKESYEVYAPSKGLIFYVSENDTFKYIGGK
jgi:hypothetical protein